MAITQPISQGDVVYVAEFRYNRPNLVKVPVVKETTQTVVIANASKETLLGSLYLPGRLLKTNYSMFHTMTDAVQFLYDRSSITVLNANQELSDLTATATELKDLLDACREKSK